ncbi:reverse transcriptase domain-containing protein [Tanacetum coccineum]
MVEPKRIPQNPFHEYPQKLAISFKYKDTENEAVHLMMFPLSLTGEAKTWLELNEGTIETWDELRTAFISRFFPPALFDDILKKSSLFLHHENESLTDAWLRMKEMLQNCHGHNLSKGNIIKIFYHGLSEITQEVLNAATGGNTNTDTDKIMARMDAMTIKMDAQYKELQSRAKQPTPDLNDNDIPMSREEEAKFILADKQSSRPSGSLPSNTQPNPRGSNFKAYQPPQARNEHVNVVFTRSADLGASINLMAYSLYAKLSLKNLKPTKMSVRLADRSFQYPVGIAENMLVEVGKFTFPADFIILKMEEDSKVPLILG